MLTRSEWFARLVALVGLAEVAQHGEPAETGGKASKAFAKYRNYPKAREMSEVCKFYIPPGGRAGTRMMGRGRGRA